MWSGVGLAEQKQLQVRIKNPRDRAVRWCCVWPWSAITVLAVTTANSSELSRKGNLIFGRRCISHQLHRRRGDVSKCRSYNSMDRSGFFIGTPEEVGVRDERVSSHCCLPPSIAALLFLLLWSVFWTSALE